MRAVKSAIILATMFVASIAHADVVYVADKEGFVWVHSGATLEDAERQALNTCKAHADVQGCQVLIKSDPKTYGFTAFARTPGGAFGASWALPSEAAAKQRALQECVNQAQKGETCTIKLVMYDDVLADVLAPERKHNAPGPQDVNGDGAVSSRTSCVNADCVRVYEDGTTINIRAASCWNPVTRVWEWKADGC